MIWYLFKKYNSPLSLCQSRNHAQYTTVLPLPKTCLWLCVVGIVWVTGFALILTAGEPRKKNDGVIFVTMPFIEHMRWYHVFAFLWVTQFILACQDVTIAGAVAQWYFTRSGLHQDIKVS
uniref:Choline transporter-like protein n=1 Tax=Scylla olivacea TaxID=85551 RepID=A0A0P4VSK5_SCYOL